MEKILFVANVCLWRDRTYGNTYHSVRVTRCADGFEIVCPFTYGYGDHYKQTALEAMAGAGWLPARYCEGTEYMSYPRENEYPISWNTWEGTSSECKAHGKA